MLVNSLNLSCEITAEFNLIKMEHESCAEIDVTVSVEYWHWASNNLFISQFAGTNSQWQLYLHLTVFIYMPLVLAIHFRDT